MNSSVKIAFTSCTRIDVFSVQPQWGDIAAAEPDYLFLLGDNIYMDYGIFPFSKEPNGSPRGYCDAEFEAIMRAKYVKQWDEPHFSALWKRMHREPGRVYGIWDDHDFAWDNACGMHTDPAKRVSESKKAISRRLFHEFVNGKKGCDDVLYRRVDIPGARVLFLDNRSYAQEGGKTHTMLGAQQWEFLQRELEAAYDGYTLICAGLSLTRGNENWSRYRDEYARFRSIASRCKNLLYVAGDIHENAFLKPGSEWRLFGRTHRPCHEIIASGMAVNLWGMPFSFDDRRNWGMLELTPEGIDVTLHDKKGPKRYRIERE